MWPCVQTHLFELIGGLAYQAQVNELFYVDLSLHEAKVLRGVDISLQRVEVRYQVWVSLSVL